MQAMILAAGLGKRLRPLTESTPKPLLPIAGKPLIVHHIERLKAAGVQKIVINVHYLAEQIVQFLGDGSQWGVELLYSHEEVLQDTGGGIVKALPLLDDAPLVVVSADIFTDYPFESLYKKDLELAHLVMVANPPYHAHGDYQCIDGRIRMAETPPFTYGNIGLFAPQIFKDCAKQEIFPLRITLEAAIEKDKVTGEVYQGQWFNIGTLNELQSCEQQAC